MFIRGWRWPCCIAVSKVTSIRNAQELVPFVPKYRHHVRLGPAAPTERRRESSGGANDRCDCGIYCGTTYALRGRSRPGRGGRLAPRPAGLVSAVEGCSVLSVVIQRHVGDTCQSVEARYERRLLDP